MKASPRFLLSALVLVGCGPDKPAAKDPDSAQRSETELQALRKAFRDVRTQRTGDEAGVAYREFGKLLNKWNPITRTPAGVKEMLGPPDGEEPNMMIYEFDTGWSAMFWVFTVESGVVTGAEQR